MKNDISFKLVTVIVLAGVIIAFFSPPHAVHPSEDAPVPHAESLAQQAE